MTALLPFLDLRTERELLWGKSAERRAFGDDYD